MTYGTHWGGFCDSCRQFKFFGSEEARDFWKETHHIDALEDRLHVAELEVEAAQKRVDELRAKIDEARTHWTDA